MLPPHEQTNQFLSPSPSARQTIDLSTRAPCQKPDHSPSITPPRFFGLLIGINEYSSAGYAPLRGAESDARRWRDFLRELGGPGSQIALLLGPSATRKAIVTAFEDLAGNDLIEEGDPIVIFYAGHGGEVLHRTPDGKEHKIQMVVPYDYCSERGKEVHCIPNLEIGALIDRIAETKGDNITVIMDCCHSASGTRGSVDPRDIRARSIELPAAAYNSEVDCETNLGAQSGRYSRAGLRSHMLLAACASTEKAHEHQDKGIFSTALLDLFRKVPLNQLRYCDILRRMQPIPKVYGQNPQCEGFNSNRFLFNLKVSSPLADCYSIEFRVPGEDLSPVPPCRAVPVLTLDAGSAHGITVGAQFAIYAQTDTSFKTVLTTVTVKSLAAFFAIMTHSPGLNLLQPSVAVQINLGQSADLHLFIPRHDTFRHIFEEVIGGELGSKFQLHNIILVDEEKSASAHLQASMGITDEVTFEMKDHRVTQYGFDKRFEPVGTKELTDIAWVLSRIAHYYRNLDHANAYSDVTSEIELEFYKLDDSNESDWRKFKPESQNLYRNGVVDFEVDEGAPYGLKLINNSSHDLYPYLFFFISSNLSIASLYETSVPCSSGYTVESSLKSKGTLAFGYGSGGVPPCTYKLDNEDSNVDFLKIVFTTRPIDISKTSQPSPFQRTRAPGAYNPRFPNRGWDSLLIPIIQRKPRANSEVM